MMKPMSLAQLKTINAPASAVVEFVKMNTREVYTNADATYIDSFRWNHSYAAFDLLLHPSDSLKFGELIADLQTTIGNKFEWRGHYGELPPNVFTEDTPIAFVKHSDDAYGEVVTWHYDGSKVLLFITGE